MYKDAASSASTHTVGILVFYVAPSYLAPRLAVSFRYYSAFVTTLHGLGEVKAYDVGYQDQCPKHHRDAVYGASLQLQYSFAVRLWYSLVRIRDRESVLNCESLDHRLRVTLLIGYHRRYLTI